MTKKEIKQLVKNDLYGWIKNSESDCVFEDYLDTEEEYNYYWEEFKKQKERLLKFLEK